MTDTLRSSATRRRDRHSEPYSGAGYCVGCTRNWPCHDFKDAQSDLDTLNNAKWNIDGKPHTCRLVPDPEEAS